MVNGTLRAFLEARSLMISPNSISQRKSLSVLSNDKCTRHDILLINFLKMEHFIAIKFLNSRFVEALNMWGPRFPRRAFDPAFNY